MLAGLGARRLFRLGGRLTVWACVAASLIYPAVLLVSGLLQTVGSPETWQPVLLHAAMIAIASVCAAVVCYFLLRNTKLVQGSGD